MSSLPIPVAGMSFLSATGSDRNASMRAPLFPYLPGMKSALNHPPQYDWKYSRYSSLSRAIPYPSMPFPRHKFHFDHPAPWLPWPCHLVPRLYPPGSPATNNRALRLVANNVHILLVAVVSACLGCTCRRGEAKLAIYVTKNALNTSDKLTPHY